MQRKPYIHPTFGQYVYLSEESVSVSGRDDGWNDIPIEGDEGWSEPV